MAARKTIGQLQSDLLKVEQNFKRLSTEIKSLTQGTKEYDTYLKKISTEFNKLTEARNKFAAASSKIKDVDKASNKQIQDNLKILDRVNKTIEKTISLKQREQTIQKRVNDALAKQRDAIEKRINKIVEKNELDMFRLKVQMMNREKDFRDKAAKYLIKLQNSSADAKNRAEQRSIKLTEQFEVSAFRSKVFFINREKALKEKYSKYITKLQLSSIELTQRAEARRISIIERNEIQSFRSKVARIKAEQRARDEARKKEEREAARQAKRENFGGAFSGAFTPQKLGSTLGTILRFGGIAGILAGIVGSLKEITVEAFRTFTRLEQQFASLSAVSGATAEQMQKVRDVTFEVASSVGYGTDEIIQLQTSLVKLGIPIEEVSVSIKSIAIAAKSMGEDLSNVGEAVFRVSNQFGLSTQEVAATSSVLVRAVNESALTFQEFGTAIQYVGPVAKQAGLDFNETAGYMQVLSNAGFKASKIGTGLRDIFIDLKQPGETLTQTISRLSKENIGLSEAVDLVGKTSASQLLVLMRNAEELENFSKITNIVKELEKDLSNLLVQNSKQMDTNSGRINSLAVAWEAYSFRIGSAITLTEGFLDLLGLLDVNAEAAARAYKTLANLSEEQATSAVSSFKSASGPYAQAQVAASVLSPDQRNELKESFNRYKKAGLKGRGDTFEQYVRNVATNSIPGGASNDAERTLLGVYKELSTAANDLRKSEEALTIRRQQSAKFAAEFAVVEAATGQRKLELADSLRKKLEQEEDRLQDKLENSLTDSEKRKNEIQLQAAKDRSQQLAELVSGEEERMRKEQKAEDERLKKGKEKQEIEENRLKALIEKRKEEYNQKLDSLELERQLAVQTGDIQKVYEIDLQLISERVRLYSELTKVIDDSTIATLEQKDELKDSLEVFKVNNKDITDSVEKISEAFKRFLEINPQGPSSIATPEFFDKFIEDYVSGLEKSVGNISEEDRKRITSLLRSKLLEPFSDPTAVSENPTPESESKKKPGIKSEDFKEGLKKLANDAADALKESIAVIRDTAYENLIGQLNAEKDAIQERYDYEDKVLKSQLESQLITQDEYERKLETIKKKRIQKENAIQKKIFEAEKKRDRQNATLTVAEAVASLAINNFKKFDTAAATILTAIGTTIATAQYAAQISAINQRQFFPTRFAEGGLVNGPSHAEGGVPFSVQGRGGYEMEGGEFIVNKEATKRNYSLLKNINDSVKPSKYSTGRKFAAGGLVNAEEMSMRQVELLESIAKATGGTYINTAKPVRAFVAAEDLRKSDVDLRIRERNSNL